MEDDSKTSQLSPSISSPTKTDPLAVSGALSAEYPDLGELTSVALGHEGDDQGPLEITARKDEIHGAGDASPDKGASESFVPASHVETEEQVGAVLIRVKEAEKYEVNNALGLKSSHYVYPVLMEGSLPGLVASGVEVKRRFSDFDTLHRMLHTEFRGCFVPPLPKKRGSLVDYKTTGEDFLRLRRADLQAFLRAVVAHPVLQQSSAVRVFLLQQGDLVHNPAWIQLQTPVTKVVSPPKVAGDDAEAATGAGLQRPASNGRAALMGQMGSWMSWVKQNTMAVFLPPDRELPEDEVDLRQAKELLQDLERLLQLATTSARSLCLDMERMAGDYHEFGRNMGMLSMFEEAVQAKVGSYTPEGHSASNRAADCKKMAMCQAKQNGVWKAASVKIAANLGLLQRTSSFRSPEVRSSQLQQSTAVLSSQIKLEREHYALIKARNKSELARLGLVREADFKRMMTMFANTQLQLMQASTEMWASLAKQLSETGASGSSSQA